MQAAETTTRPATLLTESFVVQAGALSKTIFPSLPGLLTSKPVVVLTNASTASASEVLTGALHGNGR